MSAIHYKDQFDDSYVDIAIQRIKKGKWFLIYFGVFWELTCLGIGDIRSAVKICGNSRMYLPLPTGAYTESWYYIAYLL